MRRIVVAIIAGIAGFFLLVFAQEYETFILPLLGLQKKINYDKLGEICLTAVEEFNKTLEVSYKELAPELIDNAPADEGIREEFKRDILSYKEEKKRITQVLRDWKLLDMIFVSDKNGSITAREHWELEIEDNKSEKSEIIVTYSLKVDDNGCRITGLKIETEDI